MSILTASSPLEAQAISLVLSQAIDELGILKCTLLPSEPYNDHYNCPTIRISIENQNIWKQEHMRKFIEYLLHTALDELETSGTCRSLPILVESVAYTLNELIQVPEISELCLSNILDKKTKLSKINLKLFDGKNPWDRTKWERSLQEEEKSVKIQCSNKERYFGKLMEAGHEGLLLHYKLHREFIEDKCQNMQWKTRLENRCTREFQSFLTLSRMQLDAEFERCILLQEELSAEKENKAQVLRIHREQMIEDIIKMEQLLIERAAEMRKFRRDHMHFIRKQEALLIVQTWWRAMITTKEVLGKFRKINLKKTKKRQGKKGKK